MKTPFEAERLNKRFDGVTALRDFSFQVAEGEVLGLIGPNGAGKTTLFNVLTGFLRPDSGRAVFDGIDPD
jgi:branched-chain amino acid transport system ATP-binding protein